MRIQIYAFTQITEAVAAAEMGVDQIGFVAGDYGLVHGELSFKAARDLCEALPEGTTAVALTMATEVDEILRMAEAVRPDIIHVSTDVADVDVMAMGVLRQKLPSEIRLMKALPVLGEESLAVAKRFAPVSDIFLLDTKVRGMPGVGATGAVHDWSISRRIVTDFERPVVLAGGLSAENVAEAMRQVGPWCVDSNTHTNIPGDSVRKDLGRIRDFVAAVRAAEVEV
jgi:phosphoribosylanthranilate isomerase